MKSRRYTRINLTEDQETNFFEALKEYTRVQLYPLGMFTLKTRAKKRMITLAGEILILPKHKALVFKPSVTSKKAVN